jgi:hypothetical protein
VTYRSAGQQCLEGSLETADARRFAWKQRELPSLFRYRAKTTWSSARRGLLSAAEKPTIIVGSPPEFEGEPNIWAPEELLVGSVKYLHDADIPLPRPNAGADSSGI